MLNNITSCPVAPGYQKKTLRQKFAYLFNETDLLALRFTVGLASLVWGIMLLIPGDTFERPMFNIVGKAMDELSWSTLFLIHGISVMCSLFACFKLKVLVFSDGVLGCFLWTGMSIGMLATVVNEVNFVSAPAASGPSLVLALATWWLLIRFPIYKK